MYIAQRARLLEKIYATQYIARLQHAVAAHGHEHGSLPRVGMNGGQPHADGQPPAKKPRRQPGGGGASATAAAAAAPAAGEPDVATAIEHEERSEILGRVFSACDRVYSLLGHPRVW